MSISLQGRAPAVGAAAARTASQASYQAVYRAVWRWHFYAGLVCLPFLVTLAATGAVYLFKAEVDATVFAHRTVVAPRAGAALGPDRLIFTATQAVPDGVPLAYTDPVDATASAVVTLARGEARVLVYLDPYTGDVLDRVERDGEFFRVVRRLHSLALFGPVANALVEVVAGFAIILVATGTYLWWPRGRPGDGLGLRGTPRQRAWWRDLHALTGLLAGAGLLFLALTGLPWSIWWGEQLRARSNAAGLGQPAALWASRPVSRVPMGERLAATGWAMRDAPVPRSPAPEAGARPIGIDAAAERLAALGMPSGYELALPVDARGVYAAAAYPRDVTRQRLISLDQYTGRPLVDVRFADLGLVARAVQYGIGIHKGEHWGRANQLAMLAVCLATILLGVTGAAMWWKRRPAGRLGVPPPPRDRRAMAGVAAIVCGLGALFPLTGLAILAMLAADLALAALRGRMAG